MGEVDDRGARLRDISEYLCAGERRLEALNSSYLGCRDQWQELLCARAPDCGATPNELTTLMQQLCRGQRACDQVLHTSGRPTRRQSEP